MSSHVFFKGRAFGKSVSTIRLKIINKWGQNYFAPELFSCLLGGLEKKIQCLGENFKPVYMNLWFNESLLII
jgi:hypothetical protein